MRIFIYCFVVFVTVCSNAFAGGIDWHVKHRFRFFFSDPDAKSSIFFRMQEQAWNDLIEGLDEDQQKKMAKTAVSLLERKLNDEKWLQEFYKNNLKEIGLNNNAIKYNAHARWGWAKQAILQRKTCWDWQFQSHGTCRSDVVGGGNRRDYVRAERHTVIVTLDEEAKAEAVGRVCRWSTTATSVFLGKGKNTLSRDVDCDQSVSLRIPFKLDSATGLSEATKISVEVLGSDAAYDEDIAVRDFLVAGLGDSYSSGEGNPDSPAIMAREPAKIKGSITHTNARTHPFAFNEAKTKLIAAYKHPDLELPNRDIVKTIVPHRQRNELPANWLDRKCHRSLYSYHNRVALQLALQTNKRTAVTFLGYACSGSKLTSGILLDYYGVEKVNKNNLKGFGPRRLEIPQLARLIEELCVHDVDLRNPINIGGIEMPAGLEAEATKVMMPKCGNYEKSDYLRPIDMLILSIGGNDAGFVPLIADVMLQTKNSLAEKARRLDFNLLRGLARHYIAHGVDVADKRLKQLPLRFEAFAKAIVAAGIPIRKTGDKTNIVMTAFPIIERNAKGEICGQTELEKIRGVTLTKNWLGVDHEKLKDVSEFSKRLLKVVKAGASDFIFVDGHRQKFEKHGFCAHGDAANVSGLDANLERMLSPFYIGCGTCKYNDKWFEGNNAHFSRCYASRQRWIRTFDDAFLCANTVLLKRPKNGGRGRDSTSLMFDSLGGPMHPTAEGHSHIADAVWNTLQGMDIVKPYLASAKPVEN